MLDTLDFRVLAACCAAGVLASGCGSASDKGHNGTLPGNASPGSPSSTAGASDASDDGVASDIDSGSASPNGDAAGPVAASPGDSGLTGDGGAAGDSGDDASRADSAIDSGNPSLASVCAGGKVGQDSSNTTASGAYGDIEYTLSTQNEFVELQTTLAVPGAPPPSGTVFLWPGLQWLRGKDPANIGNGVLQSVLTWGSTCAPGAPNDFSSWWISAQYVNLYSPAQGHSGCLGGSGMDVKVADALDITMTLSGTVWTQVVVDKQTSHSVNYSIDMLGQVQDWAIFTIEQPTGGGNVAPAGDVVFTQTVLTFASPVTSCQPSTRGVNDYFSAPEISSDGLHCCFSKLILRAQGVAATTPNSP
jgi:hypothetical protein